MLITAYVISFLGMILLPIILWIVFTRKFARLDFYRLAGFAHPAGGGVRQFL